MYPNRWLVTILAAGVLGWSPARAGVYLASDRPLFPDSVSWVQFAVRELRAVPMPPPNGSVVDPQSLRQKYLDYLAVLEAKDRDNNLSTTDRIDLGAIYIRFRRPGDAVRVLDAGDKTHFMILANLATAFFELGELGRASAYQDQTLASWPPVWAGWTGQQWAWFHRCERLFQGLLQHRQEEQRRNGGRNVPATTVDPLFAKFHLPPAGHYEAGPLPLVAEDLPAEALGTVAQLTLWLPFDGRLTWLYAELLNIYGDVDGAYRFMDELVFTRDWSNVEDLRRHKVILKRALESRQAITPEVIVSLLLLAPRGLVGCPGLGSAGPEIAWSACDFSRLNPAESVGGNSPFKRAAAMPDYADSLASSSAGILPNGAGSYLGIGFGIGALVTVLVILQGRQWLRRRSGSPT